MFVYFLVLLSFNGVDGLWRIGVQILSINELTINLI